MIRSAATAIAIVVAMVLGVAIAALARAEAPGSDTSGASNPNGAPPTALR